MGKKGGKSSGFVSKGQRPNVSKWTRKAIKRDVTLLERANNQMDAHLKGKNVMLTIENPIKSETNKPFIRVPAKQEWRHTGKFIMKDRS